MKKLLLAVAALLFCAGTAQANTFTWNLILSGANEQPNPVSPAGTGTAKVVLDDIAKTLTLDITFSGLTSNSTGAHIHCCQTTSGVGNAGVATTVPAFPGFTLGTTFGTYSATMDLNLAGSYNPAFVSSATGGNGSLTQAESVFIAGLESGLTYLNIHTTANPGGEIRAQLNPVPEPATLSLLALGLGGLVARRRRAQR